MSIRIEVVESIYLVFEGGGSDETFVGAFSNMQAARDLAATVKSWYWARYDLNDRGEFMESDCTMSDIDKIDDLITED
jgi:hypothetical protein